MAQHTPALKLFDLLVTRDFEPEMLDIEGKPATDPSEAELFSFDFRGQSGTDYGTVVVLLGDDADLEMYYSDNVGRTMEGSDKEEWFAFLKQMKNFATENFMDFTPLNLNRLRWSMQSRAAIKESIFESWTGTKTTSWNGRPTEARLMIRHKRPLGETDARFRYVESLFIETAEGERYKLPFTKLSGGRAMLEHVRQGGRPYDIRGNHIATMVEEINVLSRFRRANQGRLLEGDTAQLVEDANQYYENLLRNLKSVGTGKGYKKYFESWNPAEITEEEVVVEGLKHLFVTQSIDDRIESALPLLARIQQQGTAMKEANIFETWANTLVEGTWQLPDTPEKQAELVELMSQDLPVGADAMNATEQLYNLLGDDHLFDQLEELAERDANADARQVVYDRLFELSEHPEVRKVIEQLQISDKAEMNPPEGTPADLTDKQPQAPEQVPGGQGNITRLGESRMLDEDGSKLEHILDRFRHEVRNFEQGGDLDDDLYDALFDYYCDTGDMPYPVQKARKGDPREWVAQNLESHLRGGGIVGGEPDKDYAVERESVEDLDEVSTDLLVRAHNAAGAKKMDILRKAGGTLRDPNDKKAFDKRQQQQNKFADAETQKMINAAGMKEAVKDPHTQTEDPYNSTEPTYPEYEDPLSGILKSAGVPAEERPAPEYNHGDMEEGVVGAALGGPVGAVRGATLGNAIGDAISPDETDEGYSLEPTPAAMEDETDECDTSPLKGQYGHSGKMKPVSKDLSFLDRLKELSGLRK
jgi:hypothetical protein